MTDIAEIIIRSIAAFVLLLFISRMLGKKLISRLTMFDFATAIAIGSLVAIMSSETGRSSLLAAVALIVWGLIALLVDVVNLQNLPARKIVDGEPTVVIQNGKIMERNMARLRYNLDELMSQLRLKNIFDPAQVEFAVFEPNGQLSVLPKTQYQPLNASVAGLPTQYQGMITALIKDGRILEQNLQQNHLTREWLLQTLQDRGITDPRDMFYAALDTSGNLFIDMGRDELDYVQEVEDAPGK